MKLLVDTTYLLPAIGISIKELPRDAPIKLLAKGHQISISDISIFELSAKGAKYVANGKLTPERVTMGIRATVYDDAIDHISTHDSDILLTSFKLRSILNDFIDCLILSSAINQCDALVTEDSDILNLNKNKEFNQLLTTANSKFKIQKLTEIL